MRAFRLTFFLPPAAFFFSQPAQGGAAHVGDVLRGRVGQALHAHAGGVPGPLGQGQQVLADGWAGGQRARGQELGECRYH